MNPFLLSVTAFFQIHTSGPCECEHLANWYTVTGIELPGTIIGLDVHGALDYREGETPEAALLRIAPPEAIRGLFLKEDK